MEIRIYERDLTLCGLCDSARSITASEEFRGAGAVSLTVPLADAGLFLPDRILTVPGIGAGFVAEYLRKDAAAGTAEIGGRGVLALFDRRVLAEEITYAGEAEPFLLDLAEQYGSAVLEAPLSVTERGLDAAVHAALGGTTLYAAMQSTAESADFGLRLTAAAGGYGFSVRTAFEGGLLLTREDGLLSGGVRLSDRRSYANRVTVCGADGTKETVDAAHLFADGTNDAAEPLREEYRYASAIRPDRYASEADYRAALRAEGRRVLAGRRPVETVRIEVTEPAAARLTVGGIYGVEDGRLGVSGRALCTAKEMTAGEGVRFGAELRLL